MKTEQQEQLCKESLIPADHMAQKLVELLNPKTNHVGTDKVRPQLTPPMDNELMVLVSPNRSPNCLHSVSLVPKTDLDPVVSRFKRPKKVKWSENLVTSMELKAVTPGLTVS